MWLTKDLPLDDCEIKFTNDAGSFEGYSSVFGLADTQGDTVEKGAFAATLANRQRMPSLFFGHSPGRPMGKIVHLAEDNHGLFTRAEFTPGNSDAQDIRASVVHKAIDGLSIGYRVPQGGAIDKADGGRILKAIDLIEVSIVSMPADLSARISGAKAEIDGIESVREAELFLRDSGMAKASAVFFVSRIVQLCKGEPGTAEQDEIAKLRSEIARYQRRERLIQSTA